MGYCMANNPLLTIVTVTMNCVSTIEQTLLSVQEIKSSDIEYIVIDGVSTDGTLELVRGFGTLVDIVVSEPDTGIYNAMNKGCDCAKGKYILFINGDDKLVAEGFPTVLKTLRSEVADIICATTLIDSREQPVGELIGAPWRLPFYNSIPHPSSFVKTSLMKKYSFREDLKISSDYDFFLRAFVAGRKFEILPVPTAVHRRGGVSNNLEVVLPEMDQIQRERLGWGYPVAIAIGSLYRTLKRFFFRGRA